MTCEKPVRILGFGKYLPGRVLSSDLEVKYGIPPGWSERHTGVVSRHRVTFESNGFMGARAVEQALKNCEVSLAEVDMLISAAATYDYPLPNQACVIKSELGNGQDLAFPAIDIDSTCLSFVSAFEFAANLLNGNQYKTIVIVTAEISSLGLDPKNWETMMLFGDAAVAAILQYDETAGSSYIKGGQRTYSEGVYDTIIKGGGNRYFFKDYAYDEKLHSFAMNGKNLIRLAGKRIPEFMKWFFEDLDVSLEETDVVIPHQASKTGIGLFCKLYPFRDGQVKQNLATHGNCIAASIPLTFYDAIEKGEVNRGDLCLLSGTAAGFSIGAVLIRY